MLANQLPGVRSQGFVNQGLMLECACYCLHAYYNNTAMSGRVLQAFTNAWAQIYFRGYQRVVGSTPGWSIAKINDGSERGRFVIAIEGTTNPRQWWTWSAGATHQSASPLAGYVWNTPWAYATDILTALAANTEWTGALLNNHPLEVIVTGHSLGSSIAEILAYRLKQANPVLRVKYCKFASHKLGNVAWYEGRNRQVMGRNIRTQNDLIHLLLGRFFSRSSGGIMSYPTGIARLVVDPNCETIRLNAPIQPGYGPESDETDGTAIRHFFEARTGHNAWLWHEMRAYRRVLTANLENDHDLLWYRMKFMEYPDEWNEQGSARPLSSEADLAYNQDGEAPLAVTVPQGLISEYEIIHGINPSGGFESGIGGGDDGFDSGLGGGSDETPLWQGDLSIGGGADWDTPTHPDRFGDFRPPVPDMLVQRRRRRIGVR